jgi:hypothetical protein
MSVRKSSLALTSPTHLPLASLIAAACFTVSVAHAAVPLPELDATGEQCSAFIETDRPGGDVTVPDGAVYHSLGQARRDALDRCSLTNLAEEGWGPCHTWCAPVDRWKAAILVPPKRRHTLKAAHLGHAIVRSSV